MDLLSTFAPRRLRRYRQISRTLVRHGFGFLLQQTRPRRLALRRRQPERPTPPPARYLVQALEELGPTFVKLGQLLSTRPDLVPPDFVAELARLQDQVAPFPFEQARELVEAELGAPLEHEQWALDLLRRPGVDYAALAAIIGDSGRSAGVMMMNLRN